MATTDERLERIEQSVSRLEQNVSQLTQSVSRVEHGLTALAGDFKLLVVLVQGVTGRIDSLERRVDHMHTELGADLESLRKQVENLVQSALAGRTYDAERWRDLVRRLEALEHPPVT